MCVSFSSYFLWSISQPGKGGSPNYDLAEDEEARVTSSGFTPVQLRHERVITKVFKCYKIPLKITDAIRAAMKTKLWRMGKLFSKLGGTKRQQQLEKWRRGDHATWNFQVNETEVSRQLLHKKRKVEAQMDEECTKRRKLESELGMQQKVNKQQAKVIARISTGRSSNSRGSSSKAWTEYSRQQQYNKKKGLAKGIQGVLSFCEDERFRPCTLELENIDTGNRETLDIDSGGYSKKEVSLSSNLHSALYDTVFQMKLFMSLVCCLIFPTQARSRD